MEDANVCEHSSVTNDNEDVNRKPDVLEEKNEDENEDVNRKPDVLEEENEDENEDVNCKPDVLEEENDSSHCKGISSDFSEASRSTFKEVEQQAKEIQSESQKRAREFRQSLPYHTPKQRSILEFLKNRPCISSTLPVEQNISPAISMKMSKKQLEYISKKLEEREQKLALFYKSDDYEHETENKTECETYGGSCNDQKQTFAVIEKYHTDSADPENKFLEEVHSNGNNDSSINNKLNNCNKSHTNCAFENEVEIDDSEAVSEESTLQDKNGANHDKCESAIPILNDKKYQGKNLIEKYSTPVNFDEVMQQEINKNRDLLKHATLNFTPKLNGCSNEIIDFSGVVNKPDELKLLQEKLLKHSYKVAPEEKKQLRVVSVVNDEKRKEVIVMPVTVDEGSSVNSDKPGIKLQNLKNCLQSKIQELRFGNWKNVEAVFEGNDETYDADDEDQGAELTDLDETSDVDEDSEFDDSKIQNESDKNSKLAFISEEAEEYDRESGLESPCSNKNDESESDKSMAENFEMEHPHTSDLDLVNHALKVCTTKLSENHVSQSRQSDDDIPLHPPESNCTPKETRDRSELTFLSPVINLTGLQRKTEMDEINEDSISNETEFIEPNQREELPENLHTTKLSDLTCLRGFEATLHCTPSSQDILDICSGTFSNDCESQDGNDHTISHLFSGGVDDIAATNEPEKCKSDSDDSDDFQIRSRKGHKKTLISDDEGADAEENSDANKECLNGIKSEYNTNKIIEYDSEENEIEDIADNPIKAKDFLEEEAELSESEWDSEDEDERGLDALEFEQGDDENFDNNAIRTDLEKIHMRRILDEDNREVKLLQELLLEDGELHGFGRQRQFKWKNTGLVNEIDQSKENAEEPLLEVECDIKDEMWRKQRYEREMFLQKEVKLKSDEESEIFKFGITAVCNSDEKVPCHEDKLLPAYRDTPRTKTELHRQNKRGSFLTRNEKDLSKLANSVKPSNEDQRTCQIQKNFIFESYCSSAIASNTLEQSVSVGKKRKVSERKPWKGTKKQRIVNPKQIDRKD